LRWAALAAVLTAVVVLAIVALTAAGIDAPIDWLLGVCMGLLPLAIGAAILRYRLYDLDRISRTLAYGLLTVLLGGGYARVVLGFGQLLGRSSSLVVAGRPWRWQPRSSWPAAASRWRWTAISTGDATTPRARSRRSAPGSARRSTWTRSPPS
jgi:hypothetical protein